MPYKKSPAQVGLERKLKSWDNRELGMQIGACLNKAVDITIAYWKFAFESDKEVARGKLIKDIEYWTDILFKIGSDKKIKETTPQPVDKTKANKDWDEKKQEIYDKDSKVEDINKEANLEAEGAHCRKCGDSILGDEDGLCARCAA